MKKILNIALVCILVVTSCQQANRQKINTLFPKPTGKYNVGTESILFTIQLNKSTDSTILENRYLNVQIWYPIKKENSSSYAPYILDSTLISALKNDQYLNLKDDVINGWDSLKTYARLESHSNILTNKYPLIIFSHGFGMSKVNYSSLSIEIASHGYVVAAIDHPGSGLTIMPDGLAVGLTPNPDGPDGKVIEFCEDISHSISDIFNTERFGNYINKQSIGVIGHSLGGAAALNIGQYDDRVKASINLDGYLFGDAMKTGVTTPFLSILQRPQFGQKEVSDSLKIERRLEWEGIIDKSNVPSYVVNVKGLMHFDFSDLPFIIPDSIRTKNGGVLNAHKSHEILSTLIVSYFNMNLKNDSTIVYKDIITQLSEVNFELNKHTVHNKK